MLISVESKLATHHHVVVVWREMIIDYESMYMLVTKLTNLFTGNAPYSTGIGICTSTVRCQSWYCPNFFSAIIIFRLATSLCYVHLMSPKSCDTSKDYRYGNRPYDNTSNAIVMLRTIIGTIIGKITVSVMPS
jgi:hypothetical protein